MSYLVLARKYRPQVFEDVVGQSHVTRTLGHAISSSRVAHAYLFSGPRGVGKTTAARILAKALNCEKGPAPVPCNTCSACTEITGGHSMDVLEIDGASNRGINEVRELRENARYAPSGGRFKVYIIDEVHMLTNEAFNALLKTLEEPPPQVIFVLATTEPFKVPSTILSRCQRFDFARIPAREIAAHLGRLMKEEKIEAEPEALLLVARRAAGGVRDALSLLDQIIAAAEGTVKRERVEEILGLVGSDFYHALVERLAGEDAGGALKLLDEVYTRGADPGELAEGLAAHLRDLLLVSIDPGLTDLLESPESEVDRLRAEAEAFSTEVLTELVDRAADISGQLRTSRNPRLTLEITLAEMAQAARRMPIGELAQRLLALEERLGGGAPPTAGGPKKKPSRSGGGRPAARKTTAPASPSSGVGGPAASRKASGDHDPLWPSLLEEVKERSRSLGTILGMAESVRREEGRLIVTPPSKGGSPLIDRFREAETQELLRSVLDSMGQPEVTVHLEASDRGERTRGEAKKDSADASTEPPPAEKEDTRTVGELFKDEPMLQRALDMFDGEVLP